MAPSVYSFLIGQRVILNNTEIGKVVAPENNNSKNPTDVWVFSPSRNYASCYANTSVRPLPGGQL